MKQKRRELSWDLRLDFQHSTLAEQRHFQYCDHPHSSYQPHYDNLAARVKAHPTLGQLRSYSTVKRYTRANGSVKKPRLSVTGTPWQSPSGTKATAARSPQL
jgi:hypothetical protein